MIDTILGWLSPVVDFMEEHWTKVFWIIGAFILFVILKSMGLINF